MHARLNGTYDRCVLPCIGAIMAGGTLVAASEVLEEACKYLRELEGQTKDLSEQISQKLATIDSDTPLASIIRSLLATIDSDTPQASIIRSLY
ncbi:hypothetical protein Vadar_031253 [Vaccinium darrowii]|uniref:Uncharacterized protein n=1 Tax=Vaccinium darrowii TaxID=229202 RepID=A0ACB7Z0H8_9ERIC|nr:hypothetical protein Vadar_031253 [Vaccinium darrowii]